MKPLRRKKVIEVTDDPHTGQERILEMYDEVDILSTLGSVDSVARRKRYFNDCGCAGPPASRCYECGALNCAHCSGHCHQCLQPICSRHSYLLEVAGGNRIRLCGRCYGTITRKRRWSRAARILLSPFVSFEDSHAKES